MISELGLRFRFSKSVPELLWLLDRRRRLKELDEVARSNLGWDRRRAMPLKASTKLATRLDLRGDLGDLRDSWVSAVDTWIDA
jgi:hypothetical protein